MLRHTKCYVVWREHSQQMLDFSVLISTSAPQLDHALKSAATDPSVYLAKNAAFRPSGMPYSTERRALPIYKETLGATLLLSIFSYFETYFFSMVEEILAFHGGEEVIEKLMRLQMDVKLRSPEAVAALSGLRTTYKPSRADKYRAYSSRLREHTIPWPSQRFMLYGLKQVITHKKRWKSADIPDLMRDLLCMNVSETDQNRFHALRNDRNKIAHGKVLSHDLKKAIDASNFLRTLSMAIDTHVVEKFMVVERYAH